jgi:PAS domain S-box-containing protein
MHDLSPHATLLYASDSIEDVLGYEPEEVVGKSCFDYFHPDELPFARDKHGESIQFDNAAVLSYCRSIPSIHESNIHSLKNKEGKWTKCECVFTVVYDVFIAATTLYKRDRKSDGKH